MNSCKSYWLSQLAASVNKKLSVDAVPVPRPERLEGLEVVGVVLVGAEDVRVVTADRVPRPLKGVPFSSLHIQLY